MTNPNEPSDIVSSDRHGRTILTLGQLRPMIVTASDDTYVHVSGGPDGTTAVGSVGVPGDVWSALTFLGPDSSFGLDDVVVAADSDGRSTLTIGQFKEISSGLPDETQVVVEHSDWFSNVSAVTVPSRSDDAMVFVLGVEVSSRQF